MKPTLKILEEKFQRNAAGKNPLRTRVKNAIDMAFLKSSATPLQNLVKALEKEGIATVLRQNEEGRIYGITYVDHKAKVVFNGSDLGKQYSAKAILERCGGNQETSKERMQTSEKLPFRADGGKTGDTEIPPFIPVGSSLIDNLLEQEYTGETLPFELRRNKKKKRKRLSNDQ
jgi:hypothetical protein